MFIVAKLERSIKGPVFVAALAVLITATDAVSEPLLHYVEMRDGVELETYIYLPDGEGPFPVLVSRTIYGLPISPIGGEAFSNDPSVSPVEGDDDLEQAAAIAQGWPLINQRGYALVVQNTRGRFGSGGIDRSWLDDRVDGYDLVEWVDDQPWSNGRIGIFGDSAVGMTAALAAAAQPPALDALYLQAAPGDPFGIDMAPRNGGVRIETLLFQGSSIAFDVSEAHLAGRGVDLEEIPQIGAEVGTYLEALADGLASPQNSAVWMAAPLAQSDELSRLMPFWGLFTDPGLRETYRSELNVLGSINVPTSIVTLWQDTFAESVLALHDDMSSRSVPTELLVVNGSHYEIDDPDIFPEPRMLSWFDHWLQDAPRPERAPVRLAVQGSEDFLNVDIFEDTFASTRSLRLSSDGTLVDGPVAFSETILFSDPARPVPTLGGRNLVAAAGSTDHSTILERDDVVVFAAPPEAVASTIAGRVSARITVASSTQSFDINARLVDIAPDGTASLILSALVRATPDGEGMARIDVDLGHIVHRLPAGHQVALILAGSDFPAWDRNPQTGASIFEKGELQATELKIIHGGSMPSTLNVPWARIESQN